MEKNYDFLSRLSAAVHPRDLRVADAVPRRNETVLDETWRIAIAAGAGDLTLAAAEDLRDFLYCSMNLSLPVIHGSSGTKVIYLQTEVNVASPMTGDIEVASGHITINANSERALRHCMVRFEDLIALRGGPFFPIGTRRWRPGCGRRSVHSGCGLDEFPDWQLDAILHAGFDAIEVFVKDFDTTTRGYCNINHLIARARHYGLETVLYSYLRCDKHPDEPDAEKFFDAIYGELFRHYPDAAALSLVGESLEFPSRDPHTSGKSCEKNTLDGIPDTRPSTGYYPCCDYPHFIERIRDAVHKVKPDAEVIFSTYNWGYLPFELRKPFLEHFPAGVTLQITYEIFKANWRGTLAAPTMDYSISAVEPGEYFTSEVRYALDHGIKLRFTGNLAGSSWDFGSAPYVPTPYRWLRRMQVVKKYLAEDATISLYDSHHYGWYPNPAIELGKLLFDGGRDDESPRQLLRKVAVRDYGVAAAGKVCTVWRIWSNAMNDYVASNEDQYGPWRVGPAYPFIFHPDLTRTMEPKAIQFPTVAHAHFGWRIIETLYRPLENEFQSPGPLRYPVEIRSLQIMLKRWRSGTEILRDILPTMPAGAKRERGERLLMLGKFIEHNILTTIHIKRWWLVNIRLQGAKHRSRMLKLLDELETLRVAEAGNVQETLPLVDGDSRLGWEPSMEYVCDRRHLEWKLRQLEAAGREMALYRQMVELKPE